jgi:deoxyribodipyrimidine photo-lyase
MTSGIEPHAGPATRAAGLARLHAFAPLAGRRYAAGRNSDPGPGRRTAVSMLSPFVRRRLVTEEEVIAAALSRHGSAGAEKFVQEVVWRSYFKGWLEMRPAIWRRLRSDLERLAAEAGPGTRLRRDLDRAREGRTGIDAFDAWAQELAETGWLHNHTRMWVASIWTFTLGLPWQAGAAWFARHLVDFDPASNTLGWRWVAGIHTPGKHYLARAANIRSHTEGRFDPSGELNERALPIAMDSVPEPLPLLPAPAVPQGPLGLLVTEEDMTPELWGVPRERIQAAAVLDPTAHGAPADGPSGRWSREASADTAARLEAWLGQAVPVIRDPVAWSLEAGVTTLVTTTLTQGYGRDWLEAQLPTLAARERQLVALRRRWDDRAWPHATRGFFRMREQIPDLIAGLPAK